MDLIHGGTTILDTVTNMRETHAQPERLHRQALFILQVPT
jgi:hypothetical protein